MEEKEKQGTFKIDLTGPDSAEEKISNIVHARKPDPPKSPGGQPLQLNYVVIGFIVIGIVFILGFFSLRSAINAINMSGATEIANLSKELNDKITAFNQQVEEQKTAVKNDISGVEKKIKAVESSVATANKAEKSSKSELQAAIGGVEKNLDPIKKDIEELKTQTGRMTGKTEEAVSSLSKIQAAIQKNQQEIEKTSAANIDSAKLEAALKKEREANKQIINSLAGDIASLKKNIKDLDDRISKIKSTSSIPSSSPSTNHTGASKPSSSNAPAGKSGSISEEEIH